MEKHIIELSPISSNKDFRDRTTNFKIKQNDVGTHKFVFPYEYAFDYAVLKFIRPDGNVVVSEVIYGENNLIEYDVANEVIAVDGAVKGEISFYKDASRISTNCFNFTVLKEINVDNAITEEETSALNDLVLQIGNTKKEAEESFRKFLDNDYEISDNKAFFLMNHNTIKRLDADGISGIVINDFELKNNGLDENDENYLLMHTSELVFSTSENEFAFESEKNIIFTGLDCENKQFYPLPNTKYIITFYYDGSDILAFVGGYDID